MKKGKLVWILLVLLGLVVLFNILGIIVELLFHFNVFNVDSVNVRGVSFPSFYLSLVFIVLGIVFWIKLFKLNEKAILWWHIFAGGWAVTIAYKIFEPTYLIGLVPYYFLIAFSVVLLIWGSVFLLLKKKFIRLKRSDSN